MTETLFRRFFPCVNEKARDKVSFEDGGRYAKLSSFFRINSTGKIDSKDSLMMLDMLATLIKRNCIVPSLLTLIECVQTDFVPD